MSNNDMHENKVQTCLTLSAKESGKKTDLVRPRIKYCDRDHE
jgi:hypothetical protein